MEDPRYWHTLADHIIIPWISTLNYVAPLRPDKVAVAVGPEVVTLSVVTIKLLFLHVPSLNS